MAIQTLHVATVYASVEHDLYSPQMAESSLRTALDLVLQVGHRKVACFAYQGLAEVMKFQQRWDLASSGSSLNKNGQLQTNGLLQKIGAEFLATSE